MTDDDKIEDAAKVLHDMQADGRRCCFCGKPKREVKRLVTNGAHTICNECIGLCVLLLQQAE